MALIKLPYTPTSVKVRVKLMASNVTTGAGLTGLAYNTASLIIAIIDKDAATTTAYTQAGSTIETISTLGTYAAPTDTKCRFKEVDSTNHKGIYELQFADAIFANKKELLLSISGAANLAEADFIIDMNGENVVQLGNSAQSLADLKDFADTGYDPSTHRALVDLRAFIATELTESSAGLIAAAFKKFFDKSTPTGTINSIPDAVAGANGGLPTTNGTKINQTVDLTAGQTIAATVADKTGYSLSATGADLILSSSTFAVALATAVWALGTRTLSGFGTLVADVTTAVWGAATRTLSAFGFTPSLDSAYDAAKTAATQASVNAIPTTPLLTGDARLDNLDAKISTRSAPATAQTITAADTAAATAAQAEITAIKAITDEFTGAFEADPT